MWTLRNTNSLLLWTLGKQPGWMWLGWGMAWTAFLKSAFLIAHDLNQ